MGAPGPKASRYDRLRRFPHADFAKLAAKRVAVVGVGGLGALAAEILARAGVGRLALFDYDILEEANLNRLVYRTSQLGQPKVKALQAHLADANPDAEIAVHPYDVTNGRGYVALMGELEKADLVLGCVDTFAVRLFLNAKCVAANVPLIDGGASEDGINGSVHVVIPRKTACYRCNRPALKQEQVRSDRRDVTGVCAFTSLPTTMAIVASLQCQEAFKVLLKFGKVAPYLMYNGLVGTLERVDWKRDPKCPTCGGRKR
ncbi:MAG TPA: ThiF family adenylyltransferase [Thermoplasmata archaeon]|nr:ThiF family adenylyltransferase [Thermoplasmata archaeon]